MRKPQKISDLRDFLDEKFHRYNVRGFIPNDPISIPHRFQKKQRVVLLFQDSESPMVGRLDFLIFQS